MMSGLQPCRALGLVSDAVFVNVNESGSLRVAQRATLALHTSRVARVTHIPGDETFKPFL